MSLSWNDFIKMAQLICDEAENYQIKLIGLYRDAKFQTTLSLQRRVRSK